VRERGFFGLLFTWMFVIFNLLMALWLFSYWGTVGQMISQASSDAARAGGAVGATIGSGVILFLWVAGANILGLFALLTRGKATEETLDG
jgi:hypothetical protein